MTTTMFAADVWACTTTSTDGTTLISMVIGDVPTGVDGMVCMILGTTVGTIRGTMAVGMDGAILMHGMVGTAGMVVLHIAAMAVTPAHAIIPAT